MKLLEVLLKNNQFVVDIDDELNYDEDKKKSVNDFIQYCVDYLGLSGNFKVKIIFDRVKHSVTTTAYYNDRTKEVVVYGKNRMLGDILRSVAHELVHKKQFEEDRIKNIAEAGSDGSEFENEANAKAGEIIRKFGRDNKEIFE